MNNIITAKQLEAYQRDGFLLYGQVFDNEQMVEIHTELDQRINNLPEDTSSERMFNWHNHDEWLLELAMRPEIVDLVEGIIGSDIALFNTRILSKPPSTGRIVPWHQDADFWPLEPREATTFWLAVDDVTKENGAMQVIPGAHRNGTLEHVKIDENGNVFDEEIRPDLLNKNEMVTLTLSSGECSFHEIYMPHASGPNTSPFRRGAFIARYIPTYAKLHRTEGTYYDEDYPLYWIRGNPGANRYVNL